ncbi:MAG: superoxide dismutase [Pseudomonadota bacterium]|nr:superoxide dismutase [Pseudomonadota bacterium]
MTIQLPNLPFDKEALSPFISAKTIDFHYGKHHQTYIKNTNDLIKDTPLADKNLRDIILISAADTVLTPVFNNAAQCFNHDFYWHSLSPVKQDIPSMLMDLIIRDFGSVSDLKKMLHQASLRQFGSGWVWLTRYKEEQLKILTTTNADTPITKPDFKPLLCIDVWEHAYYLDYQNRRADYAQSVIDNLINWQFATENLNR